MKEEEKVVVRGGAGGWSGRLLRGLLRQMPRAVELVLVHQIALERAELLERERARAVQLLLRQRTAAQRRRRAQLRPGRGRGGVRSRGRSGASRGLGAAR